MAESCKRCPHLAIFDWHYYYCTAMPDEKPSLRPGGGKQLRTPFTPPSWCPLGVGVEGRAKDATEEQAAQEGRG